MSTVACDQEVFKDGTSMGLFNMPKEEAEKYCREQTEKTGYKHDWHYVAGRVHVKALIPTEATRLRQQLEATQAKLKAEIERSGMLEISLDAKNTLLESCETALTETQAKLEAAERWLKTKARHHLSCMRLDCFDERDHGCTCGLEALTQEGKGE